MTAPLTKLTIKGYKSIESLVDFELGDLTVLIGANGSGKSCFMDFFRLVRAMADESLQVFVIKRGGADQFLHMGPQHTPKMSARLVFDENAYEFDLSAAANGHMLIEQEATQFRDDAPQVLGHGQLESVLRSLNKKGSAQSPDCPSVAHHVYAAMSNWMVYHFHDTSLLAMMRREQSVRDFHGGLRDDASNLAPFLLELRETHKGSYDLIRDTVGLIVPFFDDFHLEPITRGPAELVRLEWRQSGSDYRFQPYHLSDGTIRFICLATALLQPTLPATIVIDEPELGLHPVAIGLLAGLIRSASARTQVIISTQSPTLLNKFEPKDVIVVNRQAGRSTFSRLDTERLREWLEEYSVGELWQMNVLEGGPAID